MGGWFGSVSVRFSRVLASGRSRRFVPAVERYGSVVERSVVERSVLVRYGVERSAVEQYGVEDPDPHDDEQAARQDVFD